MTFNLQMCRGHLLSMNNLPSTYQVPWLSLVNFQDTFVLSGHGYNATVTLTFHLLTFKFIGVIYWLLLIFIPKRMTVGQNLFKILSWYVFFPLKANVTSTIDLAASKCKGVIYWVWKIFIPSTMTFTKKLYKILSRHGLCIKCYCDLDIWFTDLKMYRGHLLSMTNLPYK